MRSLLLGALTALVVGCTSPPAPVAESANPPSPAEPPVAVPVRAWEHETSDLPVDPRLHFGRLANGLRFVWASDAKWRWVSMRLVVAVGSLAEEDDELGMAHFVEHMAFNGTEHHPAGTLVEWFQGWGAEFGRDLNATTSYDRTLYWIEVPVHVAANFERGLTVMRDFAFGPLFAPEEIEAEKGVVDAEERESDDPGERIQRTAIRTLFPDSRLAARAPLGTPAARARFDRDALQGFHRRWYRPENMTLVLAGDVDGDPAAAIERIFGDFVVPPEAPARPPDSGVGRPIALFGCFPEPLAPRARVRILDVLPSGDEPFDRAHLERDAVLDLARRVLVNRLRARGRADGDLFIGLHASDNESADFSRGEELSADFEPERWREAMAAAEQELRRVLEHGFTASELAEGKATSLRALDRAAEGDAEFHAGALANEATRAAVERYVPMSAEARRTLLRPVLESLTVEECSARFRAAWSAGERAVYLLGNLHLGGDAERELRGAWDASRAVAVVSPEERALPEFAYASDADHLGEVVQRRDVSDLHFVDVVFENGVHLAVKRTDFAENDVRVEVRLGEGTISLPPERYALCALQDWFLEGGLEAHDFDELRRLGAGQVLSREFRVAEDSFQFGGATNRADLLRWLEIQRAYLTSPGWRDRGYAATRARIPGLFEARSHDLRGPLNDAFFPQVFAGDPRTGCISREGVESVSFDELRDWLAPFLAEAPLDVAIVGDVDVPATIDAVARTLGTLPARREFRPYEEHRDLPAPLSGVHQRHAIDLKSPHGYVVVCFPMPDAFDSEEAWQAELLGEIFADRLRVDIRERLGATYSPRVARNASAVMPDGGLLILQVQTATEDVDRVLEECLAIADALARDGPTTAEVERMRAVQRNRVLGDLQRNEPWAARLADASRRPRALEELRSHADYLMTVRPNALAALAHERLPRELASTLIVVPR